MRKGIVLVLLVAVLLCGGVAAVFEVACVSGLNAPAFDPGAPGGCNPLLPNGDPLPDGPA